jgi:hypothetical protein
VIARVRVLEGERVAVQARAEGGQVDVGELALEGGVERVQGRESAEDARGEQEDVEVDGEEARGGGVRQIEERELVGGFGGEHGRPFGFGSGVS